VRCPAPFSPTKSVLDLPQAVCVLSLNLLCLVPVFISLHVNDIRTSNAPFRHSRWRSQSALKRKTQNTMRCLAGEMHWLCVAPRAYPCDPRDATVPPLSPIRGLQLAYTMQPPFRKLQAPPRTPHLHCATATASLSVSLHTPHTHAPHHDCALPRPEFKCATPHCTTHSQMQIMGLLTRPPRSRYHTPRSSLSRSRTPLHPPPHHPTMTGAAPPHRVPTPAH
jgi:hypothetical protein